jgi:RimJ/RimL family protein N-acetyltransferase
VTATRPRIVATGRLVRLREKQVEDAERDYAWRRDPELAAYDAARPITMSFRSFVASMAEELHYPMRQRRTYAIEDRETGKHIGNVMYYGYDSTTGEAELGITIGDRDYWSQGYGTDAVRAVLGHLFNGVGMKRVYLHTLTWNYRAQSCFQRAGFRSVRQVQRGGYEFVYMEATPEDLERAEGEGDE